MASSDGSMFSFGPKYPAMGHGPAEGIMGFAPGSRLPVGIVLTVLALLLNLAGHVLGSGAQLVEGFTLGARACSRSCCSRDCSASPSVSGFTE